MCKTSSYRLMESLWHVGCMVLNNVQQIYGLRHARRLIANRDLPVNGADALAFYAECKCLRAVGFDWPKQQLTATVIVDERNPLVPAADVKAAGLLFYAVGKGYTVQEFV